MSPLFYLALYAHCDQTAVDLFSPRPGAAPGQPDDAEVVAGQAEPLHVQLLAAIRAQPGVCRSELSRRFSHQTADLHAALDLLHSHGLAFSRMQATAGRQAECWYPNDSDDNGVAAAEADAAGLLAAAEEEVDLLRADGPTEGGVLTT